MNKLWKNIEPTLVKGIMIISISASTLLMSCDQNEHGGADGFGSGAENDTELKEAESSSGMDENKENPNGIGTAEDMELEADTTSNIDEGGVSSEGSGSGLDDSMSPENEGDLDGTGVGNTDSDGEGNGKERINNR